MASVNQTRLHCVNQMAKTHSKPLAAWHGSGTAWEQHAMCESAIMGNNFNALVPFFVKESNSARLPQLQKQKKKMD